MASWKKTFYAAFAAQVLSITGFAIVLPFMPLYIRTLGVQDEGEAAFWAGVVGSAAAVTFIIFAPIWGFLADRHGRKLMVMRAMFGGAVVLVLMAFCRTVGQLVVCRLMQGMLTGTVTASVALVASIVPRERAGYALGMMQAAGFMGHSVGPLLGGLVADHFGYQASFVAAALALLLGGVVIAIGVEEHFSPMGQSGRDKPGTFADVLAGVGFLSAVFALLAIRFANTLSGPVFPLLVARIRGTAEGANTVTGLILSVAGVVAALSAGLFGRLSDAWGHKRLLVVFSLFGGVVCVFYVLAQNVGHLFLLRALFGLGAAGMMPAANAIIREVTDDRNIGKAYGATSSLSSIGWALGPLIGGYLGKTVGLRAPFVVMGIALGAAGIVVALCVRGGAPKSLGQDAA